MTLKRVRFFLLLFLFYLLLVINSPSLLADDFPLVGTWVVNLQQTAKAIGNDDKAKGFLEASRGLSITMAYRPDGSVLFTKRFGDETETVSGQYKIVKRDSEGLMVELIYPLKGIRYEQIYQFPGDFLNQQVLMKGTFAENYPETESFGLAQGEYILEIFYEDLPEDKKTEIRNQPVGGDAPVAVSGVLGKSSVEDDEVYFIEAAAVAWKKEVMGKDVIRVKLMENNTCEMPFPGVGMSFIWQRNS
tara:strand:+ start:898 stop:1635 length:738 start_codon:yes stop_codon:yes gene_type:complete